MLLFTRFILCFGALFTLAISDLHYELHTPLCVYPTSLRSITIGLFTALSYIGEVVAPLDIDYALYKLSNQDTAFFAMGFVTLDGEKQIHNILY